MDHGRETNWFALLALNGGRSFGAKSRQLLVGFQAELASQITILRGRHGAGTKETWPQHIHVRTHETRASKFSVGILGATNTRTHGVTPGDVSIMCLGDQLTYCLRVRHSWLLVCVYRLTCTAVRKERADRTEHESVDMSTGVLKSGASSMLLP